MSDPELVYRHLAPADRGLGTGDRLVVTAPVPVTSDCRQATRNWADEGILAIWCDESVEEIPAGAAFTVVGTGVVQHHGASALDLELPLAVLVADGTDAGSDAVMRAQLMIRLALASGEALPAERDFAGALPRQR